MAARRHFTFSVLNTKPSGKRCEITSAELIIIVSGYQ